MYLFISLLYMFRATQCSSLGESNFINTSSGICHSVLGRNNVVNNSYNQQCIYILEHLKSSSAPL